MTRVCVISAHMVKEMSEDQKAARILKVLCQAYQSQGAAALTPLGLLEKESGLNREELEKALKGLASEDLVRYWELGDVATIGPRGIELCQDAAAFSRRFSSR